MQPTINSISRLISTVALATIVVACQPKGVKAVSSLPAPATPVTSIDTSGAVRYRVDGGASNLHILVFRAGAMARLGHNHIVSSKDLQGVLWLHNDLSRSRIELKLPVANVSVDDPQLRAKEGEEFAAAVPPDAREGTKRNLLREEVLDAEHYPTIMLQSTRISGTRANPQLLLRVTIKGVQRDVRVGAAVREEGKRLSASGEFTIKQTDFGITPFSVALGALQVQDQLQVKFLIVCLQE